MRKFQSGFSLVELMVAALIGLIGSVIIFQVFSVFEGQKRTTTSGGDAQSTIALAMHAIERDARQAGFGINDKTYYGCSISAWEEVPPGAGGGPTGPGAFSVSFVPARITQGSNTPDLVSGGWPRPDSLSFLYGSSQIAHFPPRLIQSMVSAASNYRVSNRHGFEVGDVLIAAELRGTPLAPVCTLSQVRGLPTTAGSTDVIDHSPGNYDLGGLTYQTRFNSPGLGPNYTADTTRIFNLGRTPTINVYTVSNGQLMQQSFNATASPIWSNTPIMDGIVQIQAQYGKDTIGNDGVVDVYDEVDPTTPDEWAQVLSLRVGLAARVGQYEKDMVSPATIALWAGGPVWTLTAEERHYRYRIIETIVPIRNLIWKRAAP